MPSGGRGRLKNSVKPIDYAGTIPCSFKSSHPDHFFPSQVNHLQTTLPGHCLFVGPDCGDYVGIFFGNLVPSQIIGSSDTSWRSTFQVVASNMAGPCRILEILPIKVH